MQTLLTNAIVATVAITATVMVIDFTLGLVHLAKSSQSPQHPQQRTRVEDVFKVIDSLRTAHGEPYEGSPVSSSEESPQTEDGYAPTPALQFSTVGSAATNYESMSIRELKGLASSLHIPYYSRKRKAELIEAIRNA